MKSSLALLLGLFVACANAAAVQKRNDKTVTIMTGPMTLTATRVYPSIIDTPPFMTTVTTEVVWTQYPTPTQHP
ncbi:hypothetical protein VKT23_017466 [Stygiomarasmius scandens]|uniref:Uncharacterized protein n=1 Tax=Marasmiellus scandens TaxID=2682957 RepID=A0ABR1ITG2_9AGAR